MKILRICGWDECPLCNGDENVDRILLKCNGIQNWREELLGNKWLYANEETS